MPAGVLHCAEPPDPLHAATPRGFPLGIAQAGERQASQAVP
jgi:hypothetical protein